MSTTWRASIVVSARVLNGPDRDGLHCNEGWTSIGGPGPSFKGTTIGADYHYYNWVDQFNTLGLGENMPIANGTGSDSLMALLPDKKEWVMLRVPYPLASTAAGWTAASTIRTPAGRVAASMRPMAPTPTGTSRAGPRKRETS